MIVFLSGSRKISRLNDEIRKRLENIITKKLQIFVGDANGADKAMQRYIAEKEYKNVTVFYVGEESRNNIGNWLARKVEVDDELKGRALYTAKDKAMAEEADYGFVLWDGKSEGSLNNVLELLMGGKKSVIYFKPKDDFFEIKVADDLRELLDACDSEVVGSLQKSDNIRLKMEKLNISDQKSLL